MKITCLIENTASESKFIYEHGLSIVIEYNDKKILFDTGQTDSFALNAEKLGIDLSEIDFCVLSHGHYDHGGGLCKFLEINNNAPVYLNKHAFEPHYNGKDKYIGLDITLKGNDRLVFVDENMTVCNGITLYSCNDRKVISGIDSGGLTVFKDGKLCPDIFLHEQYMLLEENGKRILISGCSHKGIINICEWFKPDILIGGFHFSKYSLNDKLQYCSELLNNYGTQFYTCHCTGTEQYEFMKKYIKKISYLSSGESVEI